MSKKDFPFLDELNEQLDKEFPGSLEHVILFGSRTTTQFQESSDYDLLIIMQMAIDWKIEHKISDICYEFDLKYGIFTDTHVLSVKDLESVRGRQPVFVEALKNGIYA